jgi:hypothetical protein
MFQDHMQNPVPSSPTSPRLAFQSRVRNLKQQRSPSGRSFNTHSRRHSELEHVSTLRVTHKRSLSAQPDSQGTPDFWAEEREAWGRKSPKSPGRHRAITKSSVVSPPQAKHNPVLSPPSSQTRPIPQPRKQARARAPLRAFEPLHTIVDTNERPKTSRGPVKLEILEEENEERKKEAEQDEAKENDEETAGLSTSTSHTGRPSKFIEGSMNERSFSIASSWFQEGLSDSDKPLPPTPPTKHVTFSCAPVRESLEEQEQVTELPTTHKRKERKGLRRSISNFNFHSLSEKMKIFSGQSYEVAAAEAAEKKKAQKLDSGVEILNERKRKADEAYAAQFGFKKQKFTISSTSCVPGPAAPSPNVGSTHHAQSQHNTHTSFRALRPSPSIASMRSPGLRKKKSRRELENENAELRARLVAQQDQQLLHHPAGAGGSSENFVRGKVVMVSPGVGRGKLGEDVPPVPALPTGMDGLGMGRGVLRLLENGTGSGNGKGEGKVAGFGEDGKVRKQTEAQMGRKSFEWPEDVF